MGHKIVEIKRPDSATPERAVALKNAGMTVPEMAKLWEISPAYVYYILHQGGWEPTPRSPSIVPTDGPPSIMPSDESSR